MNRLRMHKETMQPRDIHQVRATEGYAPELHEVRLGEVCGVQTGPFGSQLHASDYRAQGTPIITVEHLGDNRISHENVPLVGDDDRQRLTRYELHAGDIVFSRVGAIDRRALVTHLEHGWLFSGRCLRVRPRQGAVYPGFLAHYMGLPHVKNWILNHSVGSTMACLNTEILLSLPLTLPPFPLQRRIAAVLDTVDEAIAKAEAVVAKLKHVRSGLLQDLLTRGLDEHGQLRDSIAHPEEFQESPLGCIPREWEVATLVSRVSLPQGQVDPRAFPYCEWSLVAPDHIESETGRLIARQTAAEQGAISGKYVFELGDVVYSKIRPYLRKAVLATDRGLCSADMYPLRPNPGVNSRFLLAVVLGEAFSRFASAVSMRSGFPKLNRDELAEFVMGWPKPNEQNMIAAVLSASDAEQSAVERELAKLCQLKSGLMADLLTGRVRVPEEVAVAS
jgi:type I restriction enzyme S subunit